MRRAVSAHPGAHSPAQRRAPASRGSRRPRPPQTRPRKCRGRLRGGGRKPGGAVQTRPRRRGRAGGWSSGPGQRPGSCWDAGGGRRRGRRRAWGESPRSPVPLLVPCVPPPRARGSTHGRQPGVRPPESAGPRGAPAGGRRRLGGVTGSERGGGGGRAPVLGRPLRGRRLREALGRRGPGEWARKRMPGPSGSPRPRPRHPHRPGRGSCLQCAPPLQPRRGAQRSPPTSSAGWRDRGQPPREAGAPVPGTPGLRL